MTLPDIKNVLPGWAQLLERANQFLTEGDETGNYLTLKSAAVYHHPEEEFLLRWRCMQGIGVETDLVS